MEEHQARAVFDALRPYDRQLAVRRVLRKDVWTVTVAPGQPITGLAPLADAAEMGDCEFKLDPNGIIFS